MNDIDMARTTLTTFVMYKAYERAAELGFGWEPCEVAPDSFEWLKAEYSMSKLTGRALRVSSLFCDTCIFTSVTGNYAFRFWHDITHIDLDVGFSLEEECAVAEQHLHELEADGYDYRSLPYRLLKADSLGQTHCVGLLGRFPLDQLRFALWCMEHGLEEAVAFEAALTS